MKNIFSILLFVLSAVLAGAELRIVSFSPALTETLCHLGGASLLVGRSSACNRPEEVKKLPVAGNFGEPNLEQVAALKPDIVLTDTLHYKHLARQFAALKIKLWILPLESIASYRAAVVRLGELPGLQQNAQREAERIDRVVRDAKKRAAKRTDRVRVLFLVWHAPLMTVGRGSFLHELIELAGGENIAGTEKRSYFQIANEFVLKAAPEVVVFPQNSGAMEVDLAKLPGWGALPAVRSGRLCTKLHGDLFFRLGPDFDRALAGLESCFYPKETKKE